MKKYDRKIEEHTDKINNPHKYIPNWDMFDERQ